MIFEKPVIQTTNLLNAERARGLSNGVSIQVEQNELQRILAEVERAAVSGNVSIRTALDSKIADVVLKALDELKFAVIQEGEFVTVSW